MVSGFVGFVALATHFVMIATDPGDNARLVETMARAGPAGNRYVTGTTRTNAPYF